MAGNQDPSAAIPITPAKRRPRQDPRDIARRYVHGEMDPKEYQEGQGAVYQYIRIACSGSDKALGASVAALNKLWEISKMDREDKSEENYRIEVLPVHRPADKIIQIESA